MMRRTGRFGTLTALLMLLPTGAVHSGPAAAREPVISPDELAARIESGEAPLVLDVRTREEFAAGHIPGSLNIPHDELSERTAELAIQGSGEVVIYCRSGRRAGIAARTLRERGFHHTRDLRGHWLAWEARGLPTAP